MDSYCCPRCGIDFRALRFRRILRWTCLIALVAYLIHRYFLP